MTFEFKHPKYYAELRKIRAASFKQQAPREQQAASTEHQAPSANELDKDPNIGYSRINKTKPPLKVSAMSAVSKAGAFRAVSRRIHAGRKSLPRANCGAVNLPGCEFSTTSTEPEPTGPGSQKPQATSSRHRGPV